MRSNSAPTFKFKGSHCFMLAAGCLVWALILGIWHLLATQCLPCLSAPLHFAAFA
jgi:hypothetical protein